MVIRVADLSDPVRLRWITRRAGVASPSPGFRALEAVREDGSIAGMMGFDGWTPNSVTVHIALDAPVAFRRLSEAAALMVFDVCKKNLALAVIPGNNARSLQLARHGGWRETYRIRDGWAVGVDLVIHEMRRDECRFLKARRKAA